jgi:RNA polymerase sigma-70 factor (ECF subfamily)
VSRLVPPSDVEDIVQDVYVRLCTLQSEKATEYNKSFLYTVAKNLALDHIKRADNRLTDKVGDEVVFLAEESSDSTYDKTLWNERLGTYCETVQCMPKQCRKVFVMKKVYGFSQKEIAEKLGISINTVSNHLVAGMKMFRAFEANNSNAKGERKKQSFREGI